jgi:hypothetical protein
VIYNCTSECSYPTDLFNGNVRRVAIDDHNTTGAGSPAVVSRKGSATYEDSPKYSLDRGQSLDQILGGGDDSVRYEDGDGDGDGDGAGRVYSGKI